MSDKTKTLEPGLQDYEAQGALVKFTGEFQWFAQKPVKDTMMLVVCVKTDGSEVSRHAVDDARQVGDGFIHYQVPAADGDWLKMKGEVKVSKPTENAEAIWLAGEEYQPEYIVFEFHHNLARVKPEQVAWLSGRMYEPKMTLSVKFWPYQARLL